MTKQTLGRRETLSFYFLVPAIAGIMLGWHQMGPGGYSSIWINIASWVLHNEVFWLMGFLALVIVKFVFKKIKTPLILRLALATILALVMARPFFWAAYEVPVSIAQQNGVIPEAEIRSFVFFDPSMVFLTEMMAIYGPNMMLWILTCLALYQYGNFPYGLLTQISDNEITSDEIEGQQSNNKPTHFLRQLKAEIGKNVLILKAEKNYVRAVTDLGEDLVYYKFGDAIKQFEDDGLQVHRSYWISKSLLKESETQLEGQEIKTRLGQPIPVGMTFLREIKSNL